MAIGIVVEYNPFHNGHIRQLSWIKENFPNEKIIVVMSDKWTQRGELAVASFRERAKIAKKYGVDEIIKLSFEETVQAAHIYAYNAILKLKQNAVNKIVFGLENSDVISMIKAAELIKNNREKFDEIVREKVKKEKMSYPKALSLAIKEITNNEFELPNDILGFEYVKTIIDNDFPIEIHAMSRNTKYHSDNISCNCISSATTIRNMLKNNEDVSCFTPMKFKKPIIWTESLYPKFIKILAKTAISLIRKIPLISEGIENLFLKNIRLCNSYDSFVEACTSKRYTASRIKRIMAWIINKKWK